MITFTENKKRDIKSDSKSAAVRKPAWEDKST